MKNNFIYPLAVAFITVFIFSPIGNAIYDKNAKVIPFITPILRFFSYIWHNIFNYQISLWLVLLIAFLVFVIAQMNQSVVGTSNDYSGFTNTVTTKSYKNYTEDILKKWKWSWRYKFFDFDNTYDIVDLLPICPQCDMKMLVTNPNNSYACPNCNQQFHIYLNPDETPFKIKAIIANKIEKKLF